ncbi:MAG: translation initiation factor 2 subunit 2 [Candidatus Methanomethylophilaceae archaeon]|nr:translation initiation factor 2 subunit 2 [Candidatus Methanomethylophilaceae archaeon]MDI3541720.1 translation initiation factor 2 subunit 2 [Candidatus Methanomethylophilaceae archaeon]HIJ00034.1 translation initiation factor IF-2 subunit beta [Candidatus Methanomethylophilaceae archaeon]
MENDYLELLDRAKEKLPETIERHERFNIPEPDILQEGKITVLRNFQDITDVLRRDPEHMLQFLLREMGTPGNLDGRRAIFKAKLNAAQIMERIESYIDTFVICSECGRPDTRMTKEGRTLVLECDACGAHRPVHVRKGVKSDLSNELKEGGVYELFIHDVGKKGDGVAKFNNRVIFVPGTVKGTRVRVKITKISGNAAYGVVTQEEPTQ